MSFNAVLQTNNSPANKIGKSITDLATATCVLKEGTSIIDPVFILELETMPTALNYMTVSDFGRCYFVKDITNTHAKIYEVTCHVDVLESFKTAIKACGAICAKNETVWNMYLNDTNYKCYQNPHVITKVFPSGFDVSNFTYVLALCAGKTQTAPTP